MKNLLNYQILYINTYLNRNKRVDAISESQSNWTRKLLYTQAYTGSLEVKDLHLESYIKKIIGS